MNNSVILINKLDKIMQDCENKNKIFFHLFWLMKRYLTQAKSNEFQEYTFTGSEDLNNILNYGKWYKKSFIARDLSLFQGEVALVSYVDNWKKTNFKLSNITNLETIDDKIVKIELINWPIQPNIYNIYLYETFEYINKNTYQYTSYDWWFKNEVWTINPETKNQVLLNIDEIPVTILTNNQYNNSMFDDTDYLISLWIKNIQKIEDDLDIGTAKFILNTAGAPQGEEFFSWLQKMENVVKKGKIITDQMLQINPSSANPFDKMYGSLQTDQLFYSQKMLLNILKEVLFIAPNGTNKTSAQQNSEEVIQEQKLIDNDNNKNKYIWENMLENFAYQLLKVEKYLNGNNKLKIPKNIKCNIKLNNKNIEMKEQVNE